MASPTVPSGRTWRIDELAREAGLTVDTIRYYQREGLLPPATRSGRHGLYGPEHLDRLVRIKELQSRRFSLAAIRALLAEDREGLLHGVFADKGEGRTYTFDDLVTRSGIDRALAASLRETGVLRDPAEFGRQYYDDEDLELCKAVAALHDLGLPAKVLLALGRIYGEGIEATQRRVLGVFAGGEGIEWRPSELADFQALAGHVAPAILPAMRSLVDYTHHRTLQRLALDAIVRGTVRELRAGATAS